MRVGHKVFSVVTVLLFPVLPISTAAQQATPAVPQVVTVGRGEVELKPDRARIEFGVETRASSAGAAVAENGKRQRAVLDTLLRTGVAADQIQTAILQATAEMVYPGPGQPPKVSGYVARNVVRVEVLKLELAGVLLDAALAKGATNISRFQFYSSQATEARREALAKAVKSARLDAEAMVRAAGYQLGAVIEVSGNAPSDTPVVMGMDVRLPRMAAMSEPTPVSPGELKFIEVVTVRWALKQ